MKAKRKDSGGGSWHDRDTSPGRSPRVKPSAPLVLRYIATILEAPRDRLGRLDMCQWGVESVAAREAQEKIRELAIKYDVGGCRDTLEQCARVARKVLGDN